MSTKITTTDQLNNAKQAQAGRKKNESSNVPLVFACLMLGMLMSSLGQMIFSTA